MELTTNPRLRKWDKAIAYYNLASTICPDSGMPQNQLAIIGLAEGNHLEATYRLYRSAASRDPHPSAPENLHIEFKKILAAWARGEPLSIVNDVKSSVISLFIYFHAKCAQGIDFTEREEITNDILGQIQMDLKEGAFERSLLQKFALINIAAEHHARATAARSSSKKDGQLLFNALSFFRQLNMRFFIDLATILVSEMNNASRSDSAQKITPVMSCILPTMRHYSSWLLSSQDYMLSPSEHTSSNPLFKDLFGAYAGLLSALTSSFDIVQLGEVVTYLLEEDEEILGFVPLSNQFTTERFENEDGQRKARLHSVSERQPEDMEMMFRIKELVREGLALVVSQKVPILLLDKNNAATFVHRDDYIPESVPAAPMAAGPVQQKQLQHSAPALRDIDSNSNAPSMSYSLAMDRMVDNLVDFDIPNGTGNMVDVNAQMRENQPLQRPRLESSSANHTVQGHLPVDPNRTSYSPPTLPSIFNTPFAPQPSDAFLAGTETTHFLPPGQTAQHLQQTHNLPVSLGGQNASLPSSHMQTSRHNAIPNQMLGFPPEIPHVTDRPRRQPLAPPPGLGVSMPVANATTQFGSMSPFHSIQPPIHTGAPPMPSHVQRPPPGFPQFNQQWGDMNSENLWSTGRSGFGAVGSGRRQGG